jgi:hypothetical protein
MWKRIFAVFIEPEKGRRENKKWREQGRSMRVWLTPSGITKIDIFRQGLANYHSGGQMWEIGARGDAPFCVFWHIDSTTASRLWVDLPQNASPIHCTVRAYQQDPYYCLNWTIISPSNWVRNDKVSLNKWGRALISIEFDIEYWFIEKEDEQLITWYFQSHVYTMKANY